MGSERGIVGSPRPPRNSLPILLAGGSGALGQHSAAQLITEDADTNHVLIMTVKDALIVVELKT